MIAPERTSGLKITVLNPMGYPPKITRKTAAPRPESLNGKTIYLVDCRFDDSIELLKQVQAWFAEHMPGGHDQDRLALGVLRPRRSRRRGKRSRPNGDAAIVGVGHCSTCAPAVATHAITIDTKYGVPTVAIHTDKFDKVVQSVTQDGRSAGSADGVRAAAGDGQDGGRAARLRLRQRSDHRAARSCKRSSRR